MADWPFWQDTLDMKQDVIAYPCRNPSWSMPVKGRYVVGNMNHVKRAMLSTIM